MSRLEDAVATESQAVCTILLSIKETPCPHDTIPRARSDGASPLSSQWTKPWLFAVPHTAVPLQVSAGALTELLTAVGTPTGAAAGRGAAAGATAAPLTVERARAVRAEALAAVAVPQPVVDVLVDLRTFMQDTLEPPSYVSDRRLVKAVAVMQV